jgi:hypothetical protein
MLFPRIAQQIEQRSVPFSGRQMYFQRPSVRA